MARSWKGEGLQLALYGAAGVILFGFGGGAMFAEMRDAPATGSRIAAWTVLVLGIPLVLASLWAIFSGIFARTGLKLTTEAVELRVGFGKRTRFPYNSIADAQILVFAQGEFIGLKATPDAPHDALMEENATAYGFEWILDVRGAGALPEMFLTDLRSQLDIRHRT